MGHTLKVPLDDELFEWLRAQAFVRRVPMAAFVRDLLERAQAPGEEVRGMQGSARRGGPSAETMPELRSQPTETHDHVWGAPLNGGVRRCEGCGSIKR